jgi:hypothetical protein
MREIGEATVDGVVGGGRGAKVADLSRQRSFRMELRGAVRGHVFCICAEVLQNSSEGSTGALELLSDSPLESTP